MNSLKYKIFLPISLLLVHFLMTHGISSGNSTNMQLANNTSTNSEKSSLTELFYGLGSLLVSPRSSFSAGCFFMTGLTLEMF
jgi:hypothetical protein